MCVERALDTVHESRVHESLVDRVIGNGLSPGLALEGIIVYPIERHVVRGYEGRTLEFIFLLKVKELDSGIHIQKPEPIDVINYQAIGNARIARTLDEPPNIVDYIV